MTAEERYSVIREQSEVFKNKNMLRHHILLHLKESFTEGYQQALKDCSLEDEREG